MIAPTYEIFIDNFAGGGGASTGAARALGFPVFAALNHNREALAMHRMNHPETLHYAEDIRTADPVKVSAGMPVGGVWFSPDCKHFSKAKGGKPRSKHIRGLAWAVIHWVNAVAPRMIFLENVEEFQTWCPLDAAGKAIRGMKGWFFRCFVGALRRRGYAVDWREIRACDLGTPTIRKRLYLMARRDGRPIVWPAQTHVDPARASGMQKPWRIIAECLDFSLPCPSIFLTRKQAKKLKCIRPLAKATLKRIAKGVDRYVLKADRPFLVSLTHQGGERVESVDSPANTITGAHRGEKALVAPVISYAQHGGAVRSANAPAHTIAASTKDQNQVVAASLVRCCHGEVDKNGKRRGRGDHDVQAPAPTLTASREFAVVAASVVKLRGDNVGHGAGEPAHTVSAGGTHHGLVAAFVAQHNTGVVGHACSEPASTLTGSCSHQQVVLGSLVKYYGTDQDPRLEEPSHTVTTKDRFGYLEAKGALPPLTAEQLDGAHRVAKFLRRHGVKFEGEFATTRDGHVVWDLGMRMLRPRELYNIQGFPPDYIIDRGLVEEADGTLREIRLTGTAQVRMCGNSVCPPVAEALVAANLPEMCVHRLAA